MRRNLTNKSRRIRMVDRTKCEVRMFKVARMFGPRADWTEDRIREVERMVYGPLYLSLSEVMFHLPIKI